MKPLRFTVVVYPSITASKDKYVISIVNDLDEALIIGHSNKVETAMAHVSALFSEGCSGEWIHDPTLKCHTLVVSKPQT